MQNVDIRVRAAEKGVKLWEIADKLNIADTTFSRKLRFEFSESEKARIMKAINDIASEHARAGKDL